MFLKKIRLTHIIQIFWHNPQLIYIINNFFQLILIKKWRDFNLIFVFFRALIYFLNNIDVRI